MRLKRLALVGLAVLLALGAGVGAVSALSGDDRPLTWTPPTVEQEREAAKACQANPKQCPELPLWDFVAETGFIPVTDPTGATRTPVGYIKQSDIDDPDRKADTEIPVYTDSTGRTQVGTTSGNEGTRVAQ